MKYTPVMWEVFDDVDHYLGYIEMVSDHYSATTKSGTGSRDEFPAYEDAGDWLLTMRDQREQDKELVQRPDALTNPNVL